MPGSEQPPQAAPGIWECSMRGWTRVAVALVVAMWSGVFPANAEDCAPKCVIYGVLIGTADYPERGSGSGTFNGTFKGIYPGIDPPAKISVSGAFNYDPIPLDCTSIGTGYGTITVGSYSTDFTFVQLGLVFEAPAPAPAINMSLDVVPSDRTCPTFAGGSAQWVGPIGITLD
jgi:hypothetical protein